MATDMCSSIADSTTDALLLSRSSSNCTTSASSLPSDDHSSLLWWSSQQFQQNWSLLPLWGGGFTVAFTQLCSFYYIVGSILHYLVPYVVRVRNIQTSARKPGAVQRDAFYSLGPLAVKAVIWAIVEWMHREGWGFTYSGPINSWSHVLYILAVISALDFLHDGWFYWTHRLLHWGPLYRHVHYIHHKSSVPSAFTGYSFHVIEAVIVFLNEILVCFMFPIHMGVHRWYHLWTTAIHEGGHAGYEIAPFIPTIEGLVSLVVHGLGRTKGLNTVQHHDIHHRYPLKHFSLYFTHWDRWCGTLHPSYDAGLFSYF